MINFPNTFCFEKMLKALINTFSGVQFPLLPLTGVNNCPHREEEDRALPGAEPSGPRPSLSAQYQPHREKQLHYHTDGGMCSSFINLLYDLRDISVLNQIYVLTDLVDQQTFCGATRVVTPLRTRCVCEDSQEDGII